MYSKHPVFDEPADVNKKIWHYQSFKRFGDLVSKQALFFVSVAKLREHDKFEASYPERYRTIWQSAWKERFRPSGLPEADIERIAKDLEQRNCGFRMATAHCVVVNCWHMSDYESVAMWKIYANQGKGVAVQSTFDRLRKCFEKNNVDAVCVGKVKYIDYNKDDFPPYNFFYPYVYKWKSFEYEQELRAAILRFPLDSSMFANKKLCGRHVNIDVDTLIENVYVSPEAKGSLADKVRTTLEEHGFRKEVTMSDLSRDPLY